VSAAFDTVDHSILLERLSKSFGLGGMVYAWFQSYILGRIIHQGSTVTDSLSIRSGVPQGLFLGPFLYILYTADVSRLVEKLGLGVHLYADDVQLYVSGKSSITVDLVNRTMQAIGVIQTWMSSNKRDLQQLAMIHTPSHSVNNLGLRFDSELTFRDYVSKLCQQSFFHLH